jgi:hypothetical protein
MDNTLCHLIDTMELPARDRAMETEHRHELNLLHGQYTF